MENVLEGDNLNNTLTCFLTIEKYCNGDIHEFLEMLNNSIKNKSNVTNKLFKDLSNDEKELMIKLSHFANKLNFIRWVLNTKDIKKNKQDLILLGKELIKIGNEMIETGGNE